MGHAILITKISTTVSAAWTQRAAHSNRRKARRMAAPAQSHDKEPSPESAHGKRRNARDPRRPTRRKIGWNRRNRRRKGSGLGDLPRPETIGCHRRAPASLRSRGRVRGHRERKRKGHHEPESGSPATDTSVVGIALCLSFAGEAAQRPKLSGGCGGMQWLDRTGCRSAESVRCSAG